MATTNSTNNSAINFNINGNLAGFTVLNRSLLKYFIKGGKTKLDKNYRILQ